MSKYVTHKEVTSSQSALLLQNLFYDYIKENKLLFIGLLITTFLTFPVESIVLPRLYSKLFDKVRKIVRLPAITIKNPLKSLKEWTPVGMIYTIFFIWIFLLLGYGIKQTLQAKMYPEYLSFLRQKILGETIKSHQENYQDVKIGKHISRLLDFTRESRNCVNYIMGNFLPIIIGSICIILYFLKVDLTLGLAVGLGFGLIFLVLYFVGRTCVDLSCDREGLYLEMSEHIHDSLGNLMNVYLNNQEKKEIAKNSKIEKKHTKFYKAQILLTRNVVFTLSLISLVTFISVLVLSYNKLRQKVISTELFSTLVIILMYFFGYLMNLSDEIPGFLVRLGILKQSVPFLYDILNQQRHGTRKNVIKNGKVEFKKLSFKYPKSNTFLYRNIDITINPGEHVAIMGSSGSGKTTLMKLLIRMYPITSGKILIDNTDIKTMDISYLRNQVIYVNQKTTLFNDSIINNIKYGNPKISDQRIKAVIKKYDLQNVYQEIEGGIYGKAGVHGGNLSLGMQKMTILLRGVFKKGKIFVFDEPLAGLDASTREKFMRLLVDKFKNQTVIVITHDPEIIPHMDRTIDLSELKENTK